MSERTWREHCNELGVPDSSGLFCQTCKTELDVKDLVTHLLKWGELVEIMSKRILDRGEGEVTPPTGYTATPEEYFENLAENFIFKLQESSCEHLRFLGFTEGLSFIDKDNLLKRFHDDPDPSIKELEEKEMYGGPIDEPVFKTWLVQKVGGDTWVYMNGIFGDYENRDKAKEYSAPKKDEEVDKNRILESLRLQELIAIFSKDKKI